MRTNKKLKLHQLVSMSVYDYEECLLRLWDFGIDVNDTEDYIFSKDINKAKRALKIPTKSQINSIEYWRKIFEMDLDEFYEFLSSLDIQISRKVKKLSKGTIQVLQQRVRDNYLIEKKEEQENKDQADIRSKDTTTLTSRKWEINGHKKDLVMLTEEEIIKIHYILVNDFRKQNDPIDPPGIRD